MGRASVSVRTVRSRRRGKKWSPVLDEWASTVHQNVATNTTVTEFHAICANSANIGTAPTACHDSRCLSNFKNARLIELINNYEFYF